MLAELINIWIVLLVSILTSIVFLHIWLRCTVGFFKSDVSESSDTQRIVRKFKIEFLHLP